MLRTMPLQSSNRTFMELKFARKAGGRYTYDSSNRTFMELKYYNCLELA